MVTAIGSTGLQAALTAMRSNGTAKGSAVKAAAIGEIQDAASTEVTRMVTSGVPIDVEKVNAIKAALAKGTYTIDPQAIADKMIETDLPQVQG